MQQLLEAHSHVTAVFASSDVHAIGAWTAVRYAGLSVPDDVAIIGYDDIKTSAFLGLSSVAQAMHDVGVQAAEACVEKLNGTGRTSDLRRSVLITTRLAVRASSGRVVDASASPRPHEAPPARRPAVSEA